MAGHGPGPGSGAPPGPPLRGYVWHVFGDRPAPVRAPEPEPFRQGLGGWSPAGRLGLERLPRGVLGRWRLDRPAVGPQPAAAPPAYLIITEDREPPPIAPGWRAVGAQLEEELSHEPAQIPGVRLLRRLGTAQTRHGAVPQCEFVIEPVAAAVEASESRHPLLP